MCINYNLKIWTSEPVSISCNISVPWLIIFLSDIKSNSWSDFRWKYTMMFTLKDHLPIWYQICKLIWFQMKIHYDDYIKRSSSYLISDLEVDLISDENTLTGVEDGLRSDNLPIWEKKSDEPPFYLVWSDIRWTSDLLKLPECFRYSFRWKRNYQHPN